MLVARYKLNIQVGSGNVVGENTLITWLDPNPRPIAALALTTGWGSTGEYWREN